MEGAPLAQTQIPNRRSSSGGRRQQPVKRYKRRRRGAIWALYTFVAVLAVLVVGAYAAGTFFITPPPVKEARTQVTAPAAGKTEKEEQNEAGGEAPQVAGTGALKRKEGVYNFLLLGSDKGGGNADTIIVASYDTKSQKVGVLSVPRDTMVDRDWSRNGKINAALGHGGPELLAEEITKTLGVPIDYYFHINLQGFVALVDELGGVDVDIPVDMNYDDPYQNLHIHFKKGPQHLDGQAAMEAVRYRHDNKTTVNSNYSDLDRTKLQQQVLTGLADKVISWGSITKVQSFLNIFNTYVKTDMGLKDMLYFATQGMKLNTSSGVSSATLEGRGDAYYRASAWCMELNQESTVKLVNELVNPYTRDLTLKDMNLPRAERYYFND